MWSMVLESLDGSDPTNKYSRLFQVKHSISTARENGLYNYLMVDI